MVELTQWDIHPEAFGMSASLIIWRLYKMGWHPIYTQLPNEVKSLTRTAFSRKCTRLES